MNTCWENTKTPNLCWNCIKHRHSLCTGKDDPPPVGSGGPCECTHECRNEDKAEE